MIGVIEKLGHISIFFFLPKLCLQKKEKKKKKKKPVYHLNFYLAVNMTQLLLNYGYEKVQQGELSQDE